MTRKKTGLLIFGSILLAFLIISPVIAKYGVQLKTSKCKANLSLPDSKCTPGAILSTSTVEVCKLGYAKLVRDVSTDTKKAVFKAYGISYDNRNQYEVDHLISLELGGSNDISNLWPASYKIANGSADKNQFGSYLHAQVCAGKMTLSEAQKQISTDWLKYDKLRKKAVTAQPQVKKSVTSICHAKDSLYYSRTLKFTAYNSIKECLASGGRLPKFK